MTVDPATLPVRSAPRQKPHYDIAVGLVWKDGRILIDQRPADGLLGGLWELPGGKLEENESLETCVEREISEKFGIAVRAKSAFHSVKHAYTHFRITLHACHCEHISGSPEPKGALNWAWVTPEELGNYPFPKSNKRILEALLAISS